MNTRASIALASFAFVVGVASGLGGSKSSFFRSSGQGFLVTQQGATNEPDDIRGLLGQLFKSSSGFALTGVEDNTGRCNILVTAKSLHADYMSVTSKDAVFFVPYAAIYQITPEGPGPITVPVVYTTAFPHPKFCGD